MKLKDLQKMIKEEFDSYMEDDNVDVSVGDADVDLDAPVDGEMGDEEVTPEETLLLDSIVVTIAGLATTLTESNGSYTATLTLTGSEPGGIWEYTIDFKDRAGNPGIQVIATTDESSVNHDILPPEKDRYYYNFEE